MEGIAIILDNNNHSVFLLNYHLAMVVKYHRKVLNDQISQCLKEMFCQIGEGYNISLTEWNHDRDHVHVLFKAEPNSPLSKFINAYKSASSRIIKKEFPQIKAQLWSGYFWSRSFCLLTTGGAPLEIIQGYIQSQGERQHGSKS